MRRAGCGSRAWPAASGSTARTAPTSAWSCAAARRRSSGCGATVRGDRLEVTAEPGPHGVTTVISGRNNIVIATPGARATQIIGGVATTVGGPPSEPPLEVQAYVPEGAPLIVEGMVGELMVEGVGRAGRARAGRRQRAARPRRGRPSRGGRRQPHRGRRGQRRSGARGARRGRRGGRPGRPRRARGRHQRLGQRPGRRQRAAGAGDGPGRRAMSRVDEVRERPEVRVTGIGQIDIGNW